jgi:hypothetical protein
MFNNTVTLKAIGGEEISVSLVDGPTNQKTVRSSADSKAILTIAHQGSNENPGFDTQRSNVRLTKSLETGTDTGKFVSGYVQLTMSLPKDTFDATEAKVMVAELLNFIVQGETPAGSVADTSVAAVNCAAVARLYAGEP